MQKSKNFTKRVVSIILSVLIISPFFGCSKFKFSSSQEYPVTVSGVTLEKSPEKIIVLSDSLADIILALDLEVKLAARTDECTQKKLHSIPSIGSSESINIDKVLSYSPDLILTDKAMNNSLLAKVQESNIPVITLKPATDIDSFIALYKDLGAILGGSTVGKRLGENTANNIIKTLNTTVNKIIPEKKNVVTACYFYDSNKKIATGDTFASVLIESIGASNIAKSSTGFNIDVETLESADPNFIFCAENTKKDLLADDAISSLDAAKNGNVYEMDKFLMTRQGYTIIDAAKFMANTMKVEIASSDSSEPSDDDSSSSQSSSTPSTSNNKSSSTQRNSTPERYYVEEPARVVEQQEPANTDTEDTSDTNEDDNVADNDVPDSEEQEQEDEEDITTEEFDDDPDE